MELSGWVTILNTVVGIIGILVGIIGWRSLSTANKIRNSIGDVRESTIQQAQTINVNHGLDTYAIIKLSKQVTQEELAGIVERIIGVEDTAISIKQEMDTQPKIHVGSSEPVAAKQGDIWITIDD